MRKRLFAGLVAALAGVPTLFAGHGLAQAFDIKSVDQSVVRVQRALKEESSGKLRAFGHGTGFVIAPEHVVTNFHVIDTSKTPVPDGNSFHIAIPDGSWKQLRRAQVIWSSKPLDLAILQVPGLDRPPVTLSAVPPESGPDKGVTVYAIGFPGASDRAMQGDAMLISTATKGVVGKVAHAAGPGGALRPVIQHSAQINPGNSGGPLFNECNQVVGVNTFVAASIFNVVRDKEGKTRAVGAAVSGHFYSPHASNLISAMRSEQALQRLPVETDDTVCVPSEKGGLPVYAWALIGVFALLAVAALLLAIFRRNTTREIVRVVESYSQWVRRKGGSSGASGAAAGEATAKPKAGAVAAATAAPTQAEEGWILSGFDADGHVVRLIVGDEELRRASRGDEGGLVIGRSKSQAAKIVTDGSVSRRHAVIRKQGSKLTIEDLGSAYGTTVDGRALSKGEQAELEAGSKIGLGQVTLEVSRS